MRRDAFFLPVETGYRFCLFTPACTPVEKGALVYLHPFAEELNSTRATVALQTRRLSEAGYSVFQIDLLGCGDSSGDFADANWEAWQQDAHQAFLWLRARTQAPIWLWGLRAGCLLAAEIATALPEPVNFLFWQPILSGQAQFQQFLRLASTAEMLGEGRKGAAGRIKAALNQGETVEIAGYRLSPMLAEGLSQATLKPPPGIASQLKWLEIPAAGLAASPASLALVDEWRAAGYQVEHQTVSTGQFWQAVAPEPAPALIHATLNLMECGA